MKRFFRIGLLVIILGSLGGLVRWTQKALDREKSIHFVDTRPVFLPKGETLKWLSMGYRGLVSDWLWIRTVLYFGRRVMDEDNPYYMHSIEQGRIEKELEHVESVSPVMDTTLQIQEDLRHILYQGRHRGLIDYIYPMLDRVTTVDPHFIFPYLFGGVYVLMETGEVDKALNLLEKGYRHNPARWEFPLYLGWVEWMYRGNMEKSRTYLLEAVEREECPDYVGKLVTGLSRNLDSYDITRMYLESVMESTENPEVRQRIEKILDQLK